MMDNKNKRSLGSILLIIFRIVLILFAAFIIFVFIEFKDELLTVSSVKEIIPLDSEKAYPVYSIDIHGNYYMENFIKKGGVNSTEDLVSFLTKEMSRGYYELDKDSISPGGCSSFTAENKKGERIFARNYDMDAKSPIALVHTKPSDGRYESISTVNLEYLGFDKDGITSFFDRFVSNAAAYLPMDGMNEKGLGISIHMSHQGPGDKNNPTDQRSEKFDVTSTSMMRLILDRASNVEEAVEICKNIDLHDDIGYSFHYIVCDESGNSAVLQWVNGTDSIDTDGSKRELIVTYQKDRNDFITSDNYRILTNFITLDYYNDSDKLSGLDRFQILENKLSPVNGVIKDEKEAMDLLKQVSSKRDSSKNYDHTLYSVVYNLSNKTLNLVPNENYDDEDMIISYKLGD